MCKAPVQTISPNFIPVSSQKPVINYNVDINTSSMLMSRSNINPSCNDYFSVPVLDTLRNTEEAESFLQKLTTTDVDFLLDGLRSKNNVNINNGNNYNEVAVAPQLTPPTPPYKKDADNIQFNVPALPVFFQRIEQQHVQQQQQLQSLNVNPDNQTISNFSGNSTFNYNFSSELPTSHSQSYVSSKSSQLSLTSQSPTRSRSLSLSPDFITKSNRSRISENLKKKLQIKVESSQTLLPNSNENYKSGISRNQVQSTYEHIHNNNPMISKNANASDNTFNEHYKSHSVNFTNNNSNVNYTYTNCNNYDTILDNDHCNSEKNNSNSFLYNNTNRSNQSPYSTSVLLANLTSNSALQTSKELKGDNDQKKCHNCKRTTEVKMWRIGRNSGSLLCNACGLYENSHGKSRPL
eukprot:Awhi_evm1s10976